MATAPNANVQENLSVREDLLRIEGLTNAVTYANPNKAATEFVDPEIRNNKTIFLSDADVANLIPPGNVDNNTRRIQTRLFTRFKTGL